LNKALSIKENTLLVAIWKNLRVETIKIMFKIGFRQHATTRNCTSKSQGQGCKITRPHPTHGWGEIFSKKSWVEVGWGELGFLMFMGGVGWGDKLSPKHMGGVIVGDNFSGVIMGGLGWGDNSSPKDMGGVIMGDNFFAQKMGGVG
jgi:hypothetical protein